MIPSDSRYVNADHLFVTSHSYTAQGKPDVTQEGKVAVHGRDTLYLLTTGYGELPPHIQMAQYGDSMASLANQALQDPTKWWVVADANPEIRHPFDITPGTIVRLPE